MNDEQLYRVCWRNRSDGTFYRGEFRYTRDQALAVVAILEERLSRWARHWVEPMGRGRVPDGFQKTLDL